MILYLFLVKINVKFVGKIILQNIMIITIILLLIAMKTQKVIT